MDLSKYENETDFMVSHYKNELVQSHTIYSFKKIMFPIHRKNYRYIAGPLAVTGVIKLKSNGTYLYIIIAHKNYFERNKNITRNILLKTSANLH